ncbi:MAG TPA: YdcF family protein [Chlorobaculum sp.]|nr:YdcF family protein [Chlorobaculum sp.]
MKAFVRIFLLFVFITSAISATIYLGLGVLVSLHSSKPEKADVIVILGGDGGLRVKKGAELYNAGYARNIILTGIDSRYYRPTHPNWRERKLMALGVPKSAIEVDTWSETTWEEAENTAEMMDRNGWNKVIIVSDPPHMLRLHRTWKKAFADSPKRFTLVSTNPEWWNPLLWWDNGTSFRFVLSEIKKNLFYSILYY